MPVVSIGDMSQHFMSLRNTGNIKSDLARLGQELSTGKVSDISKHLGGDTQRLSGVSHSLDVLAAYTQSANETSSLLDHFQLTLGKVDDTRSKTADALLLISEHSQPNQISFAANTARIAFGDMVSAINTRHSGRSLFGGGNVDGPPLASAESMLTDIASAVGAASTTSDILQAIESWFDSPAGGFSSMGYQGDTATNIERNIGEDKSVVIDIRADDLALREILKATALAAILPDISGNLSSREQGALLQTAGTNLLSTSSEGALLQSQIGRLQETVATSQAALASEKATLSIVHNNITSADPFETATKLEAIQLQLETHFAVTGRLSRLSLLEYI